MGRYKTGGKGGQKGVDWTRHTVFGAAKILSGISAKDYIQKHGTYKGWFTQTNQERLADRVRDQMPFVEPLFDKLHTGSTLFPKLYIGRGAFCLSKEEHPNGKDELQRFLFEDFAPMFRLMQELHSNSGKTIVLDHLLEIQEKRIIANTFGPCTYLRWRPDTPLELYWGETKNLKDRSSGHMNSPLPIHAAYPWPNRKIALMVEDGIHTWLQQNCAYCRARGYYYMKTENTPELIDTLVNQWYRLDMHGIVTGGFDD